MYQILKSRLIQGYRTGKFPDAPPALSDRFLGLPKIEPGKCPPDCDGCSVACPSGQACVRREGSSVSLDMGRCIFCGACAEACPKKAISFTKEHSLAALKREDLTVGASKPFAPVKQTDRKLMGLYGRSIAIRQVSAGGCAACELDFNVLNTLAWDMGRFGIQVVASPRHADGILVTGPVSRNMLLALKKTFEAVPRPRFVIALGACAISGGLYEGSPEACDGVDKVLKADLYIPGCPPNPATVLDGILRFMGRLG